MTPPLSRRDVLKGMLHVAAGVFAAPALPNINLGRFRIFAHSATEYSERAIRLVRESLVVDMLGLLTLNFPLMARWTRNPESFTAADLQKVKDSGINVFHPAVGTGGPNAYDSTMQFVSGWNAFLAGQDQNFMRIDSASDLERVKGSAKIGILIGVQNSEHFRTAADVDAFYNLGQRVSQLTYNARNRIGDGSTERTNGGLSDFGVSIVEKMNAVGMAVDVSHSGDQTTLDACTVSKKPVLFTHSNARALNPGHPRCKTDEAIRAMAKTGGVMGITGVRNFVRNSEPTTIEHFLDHYDHVRRLVGPEHLGIGSDIDLDGYDDMPPEDYKRLKAGYKGSYAFRDKIDIDEIAHPKRVYDLAEGLIRRKYSDAEIRGILGGNFKRVLTEIWTVPEPAPQTGRTSG
jgi:membrane dipeptidase